MAEQQDPQTGFAFERPGDRPGVMALSGALSAASAGALREALRGAAPAGPRLVVDLSRVTYLDGAAAAVLLEADRELRRGGSRLRLEGASEAVQGLLELIDWEALAAMPPPPRPVHPSLTEQVGGNALHMLEEARRLCVFTGGLVICMARCGLRGRLRWREVLGLIDTAGVDAVPIVVLISTLLGLIMGFLGAIQLKPYGASIYVADMVALAMVRELGPIMTAIVVAGRSGSGFAAELGSMVVDDEVDALTVMGFDPVEYLAVPRVAAVALAIPALAMLSDLAGVLGGLVVGLFQLDLTLSQYLNETQAILTMRHLAIGLFKSVFFGVLVAGVGCYRGLAVQGGAEGVGRAATSSVVTGIFLIILADSLFAVLFTYLPF